MYFNTCIVKNGVFLQMTFKLGLCCLPLAHAGLDTLEAWNRQLPAALLHKHFAGILPHLEHYLRMLSYEQSGGSTEASKDMTSSSRSQSVRVGRKASSKMVTNSREGLENVETPLAQLIRRIKLFLCSQGFLSGNMVEYSYAKCPSCNRHVTINYMHIVTNMHVAHLLY